jgi:hypothetical protein
MMKRAWLALVAMAVAGEATADVHISSLTGFGSMTVNELQEVSPGVWRIEVTVVALGAVSFTITSDASDEIEYVKVRGRADPSVAVAQVIMSVLGEGSGRVVRLGGIEMLDAGVGWTKADLTVSAFVEKDSLGNRGNIGVAGTSPGGRVEANRATILQCEGNFTAEVDIIEGPDVTPFLNFVTSLEGDVLNDISVEGGSIYNVLASQGQIGSSSASITITADGNLSRVQASNGIWASIDVGGNVGRIETTGSSGFQRLAFRRRSHGGRCGSLRASRST